MRFQIHLKSSIFELIMKAKNRQLMKKQILFIPLTVTLVVGAVIFISSNSVDNTQQQRPKVMSMTANVDIPEKMVYYSVAVCHLGCSHRSRWAGAAVDR